METKILLGLLMLFGIFFQGYEFLSENKNVDKSSDLHVRKKRIIDISPDKNLRVLRQKIPYVVLLLTEDKEYHCTGSILRPQIILTAAHCVDNIYFFVLSGSMIIKTVKHTVKHILVHEGFNRDKKENDLALLVLKEPIDLINLRHRSIDLYEGHLPPNTHGLITGWGSKTKDTLIFPIQPLSINVPIISLEACQRAYRNRMIITPREICTYYVNRTKCCGHVDSGAPLVVDGRLVGVFSWFMSYENNLQFPDVFMNLLDPQYKLWVKSWVDSIERTLH